MPRETLDHAGDEAEAATSAAHGLAEHGRRAIMEALHVAESRLNEAAKAAEQSLRDGVDALLDRARDYGETAEDQLEGSGRYILESVKARPLTAALAGAGIGIILGLLLAPKPK